jgi:hypothetical protein
MTPKIHFHLLDGEYQHAISIEAVQSSSVNRVVEHRIFYARPITCGTLLAVCSKIKAKSMQSLCGKKSLCREESLRCEEPLRGW